MTLWETTNKPHALAKQYLAVTGKAWKQNFWAVYGFFKKQSEETMDLLHEYMCTLEGKHNISMKELYNKARLWNTESQVTKITQSSSVNYLELLKEK
jgi:hypothetical protein